MTCITCENIRKETQILEFIRKGKNSIVFLQLIYEYGMSMEHRSYYIFLYHMNIDFIYVLITNSYLFSVNEGIRIWSSTYSIFLCVIEMLERNLAFLQVQE